MFYIKKFFDGNIEIKTEVRDVIHFNEDQTTTTTGEDDDGTWDINISENKQF